MHVDSTSITLDRFEEKSRNGLWSCLDNGLLQLSRYMRKLVVKFIT